MVADPLEFPLVYGFITLYCLFVFMLDFGGFAFKSIVLQRYWELGAHTFIRKTSDKGPKRLQTVFETVANKYFPRGTATVKVIFPSHGSKLQCGFGGKHDFLPLRKIMVRQNFSLHFF